MGRDNSVWNRHGIEGSGEMQVVQGSKQKRFCGGGAAAVLEVQGLAGWVLGLLRGLRDRRELQVKQLRLVETLSLGGKRQLMLVTCAGESFLVGGGVESVETIVRLKTSLDEMATSLDGSCR
jgi:flagellar biogenesis protein FliO